MLAVVVVGAVDAEELEVGRQSVGAFVWTREDVGDMLSF
jgi:hypothetical protein